MGVGLPRINLRWVDPQQPTPPPPPPPPPPPKRLREIELNRQGLITLHVNPKKEEKGKHILIIIYMGCNWYM